MSTFIDKVRGRFDEHLPPAASTLLPADLRRAFDEARGVVAEIHATVVETETRVREVRGDDTVYPEGRERMAREAIAAARETAATLILVADTAIPAARDRLLEAALPVLDARAAHLAREDARMILDGTEAGRRAELLGVLARRGDEIAALVVGPWGRDYLTYRTGVGEKSAAALHTQLRQRAAEAAAGDETSDRSLAGSHYLLVQDIETAYGIAKAELNSLS